LQKVVEPPVHINAIFGLSHQKSDGSKHCCDCGREEEGW